MLSENIRTLRQQKGMSQEIFAQKVNVVRQTVSKWEQGLSQPDAELLIRIAQVLDTTVPALLDCENSPETPVKPPRKHILKTTLLLISSPVWLSVLLALAAAGLAAYVSLWAMVIALWAAFAALVAGAGLGAVVGISFFFAENKAVGLAMFAAALVCAGVSIFWFFGCKAASIGLVRLTKRMVSAVGKRLTRKEGAV